MSLGFPSGGSFYVGKRSLGRMSGQKAAGCLRNQVGVKTLAEGQRIQGGVQTPVRLKQGPFLCLFVFYSFFNID